MITDPDVLTIPAHAATDALFPTLPDDELDQLADDIRDHGLREPVVLYDDPDQGLCLLDGRNRRAACRIAGIAPTFRIYDGDDPLGFTISLNVRRRHLTDGQRAAIAYKALPLYEEQAMKRRSQARGEPRGHKQAGASVVADRPQEKSRDRAAQSAGTSGRSLGRFKRIAEQSPDLVPKIESGQLALDRAERIIRDRLSENTIRQQAQTEAAILGQTRIDIRQGDFRDVLADLTNVDAIITDPPYPAEHLPLLDDLAAWADRVLTPDGVLAVLFGQTHLPDVYDRLNGHRPYRWTAAYLTPGNGYASMARRLQSNWKPILIYGGGPRFTDVFRSQGSDDAAKDHHKWGQDYAAFHEIIRQLTRPGQTVADPFMGSGTTLLAAHAQGRHAVGCDLDPDAVTTTRRRLQ